MKTSGVLEKPVNFTKTITATKYDWVLTSLILHTSIELVIFLYNDVGEVIHQIHRLIDGEEYANWGVDDDYMESIISTEINKLHQS